MVLYEELQQRGYADAFRSGRFAGCYLAQFALENADRFVAICGPGAFADLTPSVPV